MDDIKELLKKQAEAFEAFKTKNDQRLDQLGKRGEDAVTKAEVAKIDRALDAFSDEIKSLWKKANRPVVTGTKAEIAAETKANAEFARWKGIDESKAGAERIAYKRAFDRMIRVGEKALSADEVKALTAGSSPDGGFYIEPARVDTIISRVFETSPMREIASAITISSNSLLMPIDRGEVTYEWVGETSTRSETTTAQIGRKEIPVHELSAKPRASQNMLDDATVDIEGWTNQKIARDFSRGENQAFVSGNGTSRPQGFLTLPTSAVVDATRPYDTLQYVVSGASGAFAGSNPGDALINLVYALKADYRNNARFVMNRTTQGAVRKLKDGQGNYLWQPSFQAGQPATLMGYGIAEFADMPDIAANSFSIAFGDFRSGYLIVDRQGIRQLRDPYSAKPWVEFYTTKRVGGAVIDSEAIKLLKFGTS